jgi:anti-sigma factor RsiW
MKWSNQPLSCARAQVLLEPYLDGDLQPERRVRVKAHLQTCAACRDELEMAKRVRAALQALPEREAPAAVVATVSKRTRAASGMPSARPAQVVDLGAWAGRHWRALTAVGALAAAVATVMFLTRAPRVQQPTADEVARAETQVRWVMTQLGAISQKTVREHVFQDRVLVPAANAVESTVESVREATPE